MKVFLLGLMLFICSPVFAQKAEVKLLLPSDKSTTDVYIMKYPSGIINDGDKMTYCYATLEKLRLEHNANGEKMSGEEFASYVEVYEQKRDLIIVEINAIKERMKKSTSFIPVTKLSDMAVSK